MAHAMTMTKGATVLNLNDQSATWTYRIMPEGWSPPCPEPSDRVLVDESGYDDQMERVQLQIQGTTQTAIMVAFQALVVMLHDAKRWVKGTQPTPVTWAVKVNGGANTWQALVVPRTGDEALVTLGASFLNEINGLIITNVTLTFRRRPLLLSTASTLTATSAATSQGAPFDITGGASGLVPTPTSLSITGFTVSFTAYDLESLLFYSPKNALGNAIQALDASGFGFETAYVPANGALANVVEAAAYGGTVRRWTPANSDATLITHSTTMLGSDTVFNLVQTLRLNTASKRYIVRPALIIGVEPFYILGKATILDSDAAEVVTVPLGMTSAVQDVVRVGLWIKPLDGSGGTVDFDVLYTGDYQSRLIDMRQVSVANLAAPASAFKLVADHQYLTSQNASIVLGDATLSVSKAVEGYTDPRIFTMAVPVQAVLICRALATGAGTWTWCVNGSRPSLTATMTRNVAALLPY